MATQQETANKGFLILNLGTERAYTLKFPIEILEKRKAFGRLDLKIKPVNGHGEVWVSSERVSSY